jgi:hypothetical protein
MIVAGLALAVPSRGGSAAAPAGGMTLRICLRISDPSARRRIASLLRKDPEVELVATRTRPTW